MNFLADTATNVGNAFVDGVTSIVSNIANWFVTVFKDIGNILYTPATSDNAGGLTVIGWIMCIVVGLSVVGFGIRMVLKLVKGIKAKGA